MLHATNLPAKIASRYIPVRLLGKGGMGVVYEVQHAWTGERLALKVLSTSVEAPPEALERFKREARASAQIKSENVVRVTDADVAPELDGALFLVMELLEGMDLERAASMAKLDPATVVAWLGQIAPALDKAHRLGIIHRDLKPENLFLATFEDRPPMLKILDFGIAKMAQEGTGATVSGQILGTPRYMAPEQVTRHPDVSSATDRCALGLIAYRLIVGEGYYRGDVMGVLAEIMHGVLHAPSSRDASLPPAFDAWFQKACHRDPRQRFLTAVDQIHALADALGVPRGAIGILEHPSAPPETGDAVEPTLPATTLSHSTLHSPMRRRGLLIGATVFAAAAVAAMAYRVAMRVDSRASSDIAAPPAAALSESSRGEGQKASEAAVVLGEATREEKAPSQAEAVALGGLPAHAMASASSNLPSDPAIAARAARDARAPPSAAKAASATLAGVARSSVASPAKDVASSTVSPKSPPLDPFRDQK